MPMTLDDYRNRVSRLPARSGSAGRPRALAVRVRSGTITNSRGAAGRDSLKTFDGEARPAQMTQSRREPGVVRISSRRASRSRAAATLERFDAAQSRRMRRSSASTSTASARSRTISRRSTACTVYRAAALRPQRRSHASPTSTAIVPDPSARWTRGVGSVRQQGLPEPGARKKCSEIFDAGRDLRERQAARDDPLRHATRLPNSAQGLTAAHACSAPSRRQWFLAAAEELDRDVEDLGQLARHARLAHRPAESAAPASRRARGPAPATPSSAPATGARYVERARDLRLRAPAAASGGFAIVAGDRHSFWAGLRRESTAAARVRAGRRRIHHRLDLRTRRWSEGAEHQHAEGSSAALACSCTSPRRTRRMSRTDVNMLLLHGVRRAWSSCKTGRLRARGESFRIASCRRTCQFLDLGGQGYATV